jgi:hypothetical protein
MFWWSGVVVKEDRLVVPVQSEICIVSVPLLNGRHALFGSQWSLSLRGGVVGVIESWEEILTSLHSAIACCFGRVFDMNYFSCL